jgi:hypothetical protein
MANGGFIVPIRGAPTDTYAPISPYNPVIPVSAKFVVTAPKKDSLLIVISHTYVGAYDSIILIKKQSIIYRQGLRKTPRSRRIVSPQHVMYGPALVIKD